MLRTARRSPLQGLRRWAPTRPVSRPGRQPATGPPGSYPDRTFTGKRRRAYGHEETPWRYVTVSPPILLGAPEIRANEWRNTRTRPGPSRRRGYADGVGRCDPRHHERTALLAPVFGLVSTWMRNAAEDASSKKILGLASLLLGLFAWLGEKFGLIITAHRGLGQFRLSRDRRYRRLRLTATTVIRAVNPARRTWHGVDGPDSPWRQGLPARTTR